jgi:hypothetical protein
MRHTNIAHEIISSDDYETTTLPFNSLDQWFNKVSQIVIQIGVSNSASTIAV